MISRRILVSDESWRRKLLLLPTNWWTSCRCAEETLKRCDWKTAEGPLGHPSHVSVSHIRNIPAISFVSPSFAVFPHCLFRPLNELQRQQAWGRGLQRNVGSCFGSRPVCTPVISTVWSLCFPREVLNPPPTPCALCKTHIHTNRCNLNVNWCECSALASCQRHQWISK